jgi:hypothetical protein
VCTKKKHHEHRCSIWLSLGPTGIHTRQTALAYIMVCTGKVVFPSSWRPLFLSKGSSGVKVCENKMTRHFVLCARCNLECACLERRISASSFSRLAGCKLPDAARETWPFVPCRCVPVVHVQCLQVWMGWIDGGHACRAQFARGAESMITHGFAQSKIA